MSGCFFLKHGVEGQISIENWPWKNTAINVRLFHVEIEHVGGVTSET